MDPLECEQIAIVAIKSALRAYEAEGPEETAQFIRRMNEGLMALTSPQLQDQIIECYNNLNY